MHDDTPQEMTEEELEAVGGGFRIQLANPQIRSPLTTVPLPNLRVQRPAVPMPQNLGVTAARLCRMTGACAALIRLDRQIG
ncbi:MAG: hypothetical protein OXU20_18160 [Myxococcales bacterium]|nr:hypothetical protein [Myxococcales bacterium]MDD9967450.1 hypothetical protein [Myxococcales bacterium]